MRRYQKKQILDIMLNLHALHRQSREMLEHKEYEAVRAALSDCQETAIQIGEAIEQIEGVGAGAVSYLERYCEDIYQLSMQLEERLPQKAYKNLESNLVKAENIVKHLPEKIEIVFLPYKASMWDSLESVWKAATEDPDCDAYVIPIPYFDKRKDGSLGMEHYEGGEYPDYVPVTHYNDYDFAGRHPDAIFIHNPYDNYNNVTSVHPFFYSKNLKQFTDMLIYIPYYSTSGGMSEAQSQCIAYYYADYIVIQAEKYRRFFTADLPAEKLLPFGSPKFDKVVNTCKNPPEPPVEWKEKMAGKKVYFYNTSIAGMLGDTAAFLKKMEYVFRCFMNRQDACLIWRPHPLLESTFEAMRSEYKPIYDAMKRFFLKSNFGIYDDTPDVTDTIAQCDAYIGDSGSSVVSMFGIVGKPVFILNNNIHSIPGEDDWRGEVIKNVAPYGCGNDEWMITQGNKLYHSSVCNDKYKYEFYCDLSEYAVGDCYLSVISIQNKNYVCPQDMQDILVIGDKGIEKKISLERRIERNGAFYGAVSCGHYLFLIPNYYPALVRYNTINDEIVYLEKNLDIFIRIVQGERQLGGFCVQNGYLFIASPVDNQILAIHAETGQEQILTTNARNSCGCGFLYSDERDLWFLPYDGGVITRWNPTSGELHEYTDYPEKLQCRQPQYGYTCMKAPFGNIAFYDDCVYLFPSRGNMYIRLDKQTGKMEEWKPPFEQAETWKNEYYFTWEKSSLIRTIVSNNEKMYRIASGYDRKWYDVNFVTNEYKEIPIEFCYEDLLKNEAGFCRNSEWMMYACQENVFNSLPDFLDGDISGNPFDKDKAERAYENIAANRDGTCGMKIYNFVHDKLFA